MPNPTIRMTTGEEKYIAGFNPNGTTRFAYTEHDQNPTTGTLQINGEPITPSNGLIDDLGNQYLIIGGTTYYKRPNDVTYSVFSEKPVSGVDPLGQFYVEGTALAPVFRWMGRGLQYPLAQLGNKTARRKIMERTFEKNFLPEGKSFSYGADGVTHNLFQNNQNVTLKGGEMRSANTSGAFLGNAVRENRGITVNGEEVNHNIPRPGTWLSDRSVVDVSGPEVTLSRRKLRRMFNKTKRDVSRYVHGEEFKDRVMNTKQFTEQDYKDLLTEIDDYLRKTKFKGVQSETGATNAPWGRNLLDGTVDFTKFDITMYPTHSTAQHRANAWHEIWHSLGGNAAPSSYPQLYKLQKFNESINPQKLSKAMERAEDPTLETQLIQQGASPRAAQRFVQYERGDERGRSWFEEEIVQKPREVRSRMQATLDRFRQLGYDTRQLINNPSLFKQWVNAEMRKGTNFSWDIGHLLQTYNINDLANYASKMLTATGAAYLGGQQMLNKSEE